MLFGTVKICHSAMDTYGLLVDKAKCTGEATGALSDLAAAGGARTMAGTSA
ncbi:hypothetical protein AB0G04_43420 [Actinoplanes sp. NPDC023801]|uniref:hypothetical protein n=1 Tax=Actinoplanes sp. NPDC023801 TaxID=3154595 RepID=UPI0034107FF7